MRGRSAHRPILEEEIIYYNGRKRGDPCEMRFSDFLKDGTRTARARRPAIHSPRKKRLSSRGDVYRREITSP